MDPSRAAELTDFIQQLDAEIPLSPELLNLVDQALTNISTGRARNLERLECLEDVVQLLAATEFIDPHHAAWQQVPCQTLDFNMSASAGWWMLVKRLPSKPIPCWGGTPREILPNTDCGPMPPKHSSVRVHNPWQL